MTPDFARYPAICELTDDIAMTLSATKDTECILTLSRDDQVVNQQPVDPRLFDPRFERDTEAEQELAHSLASSLDFEYDSFRKPFSWAVFDARGQVRNRIGQTPPFNTQFGVQPCTPPDWTVDPLVKEERWEEIKGRYADWVDRGTLELWEDDPGTGKTTSTAKGAAASGRSHVIYLPTHKNCREFLKNKHTPNGYFHLRGASQPLNTCCAQAEDNDATCSDHPDHPSMCPVFDFPKDHPVREEYEWLAAERGGKAAHWELGLFEEDWHGEGRCEWLEKFDELDEASRVVTVHAYLGNGLLDGFDDYIIDDLQNSPAVERRVTESELRGVCDILSVLANDDATAIQPVFESLHGYTESLLAAIDERTGTLQSMPSVSFDVPSFVERRCSSEHDSDAESLAWARHAYMEYFLGIESEEAVGLPSTIDFLIVGLGLAEGGLRLESARKSIASQPDLELCPRCESELQKTNDVLRAERGCSSGGPWHSCASCGWSEESDPITTPETPKARSTAWLSLPANVEEDDRGRGAAIEYRRIRHPSELPPPENTLILDATPVPAVYAHLFDIDETAIHREGTDHLALNADVVQIVNGQYPRSTICETSYGDSGRRRRAKIQALIDYLCEKHARVVLVGHKRARRYFREPANADWIDFYAGRGLDRPSADALLVIGAPFPNERSLRRVAEALTVGKDADMGTITHEREERRAYWYVDNHGDGCSVKVKPRNGLVGELFTDRVENELVQMLHRIRPVVAERRKEIYLLTNSPLPIPVTTLTTLEQLVAIARSRPVEILNPKANEILSLVTPLFGRRSSSKNLSGAWCVTDDEITATVNDITTIYRENLGSVSKQSIRNGLKELRGYGITARSPTREANGSHVYTFNRSDCLRIEYVLDHSGELDINSRQLLQACIPSQSEQTTGRWLENAVKLGAAEPS